MNSRANKNNTVIIMAKSGVYPYEGFLAEGYRVYISYKAVSTFGRMIREICFRVPFLPKQLWYDKRILHVKADYIIIRDAIITRDYLIWLKKHFPDAQINFMYENMVGKARQLHPGRIPEGIRIWTYDGYDSEKYHIRLKQTSAYFPVYVKKRQPAIYDVLFVGRDKGRGDKLLKLERYLNQKGLKTKFIITADHRLARKKSYYQKEVSYEMITELLSKSRCVLNIALKNQKGITVRDLESLFNRVKLITTNKNIVNADFYNEKNVFLLTDNNWSKIPEFVKGDYDYSVAKNEKNHSLDAMISEMTEQ